MKLMLKLILVKLCVINSLIVNAGDSTRVKLHYIKGESGSESIDEQFIQESTFLLEEIINDPVFHENVKNMKFKNGGKGYGENFKIYSSEEILETLLLANEPHNYHKNSVSDELRKEYVIDLAILYKEKSEEKFWVEAAAHAGIGNSEITIMKGQKFSIKEMASLLLHEYIHILGWHHDRDDITGKDVAKGEDVAYGIEKCFNNALISKKMANDTAVVGSYKVIKSVLLQDYGFPSDTLVDSISCNYSNFHLEITSNARIVFYQNNLVINELMISEFYFSHGNYHLTTGNYSVQIVPGETEEKKSRFDPHTRILYWPCEEDPDLLNPKTYSYLKKI